MVGYAESIPVGEGRDLSAASQVQYLFHWLDALGLDRVVLCGHAADGGRVPSPGVG
jgi:pimeloyl-ACP methyl ester carboxylesterase